MQLDRDIFTMSSVVFVPQPDTMFCSMFHACQRVRRVHRLDTTSIDLLFGHQTWRTVLQNSEAPSASHLPFSSQSDPPPLVS